MATISNVNGKKITKIKYKGEIYDTGGSGSTLKTLLDATKSTYFLFLNYSGTSIDGLISYNDTENVTNMSNMFNSCSKLTTIPQLDTSKVTNMSYMFSGCSKLTMIQLDTSNVTSMEYMFSNCFKLTTIDISHMNTKSTSRSSNFANGCYVLTKLIIRNMSSIPALNTNSFYACFHFKGTVNADYNPQGLKDGRIYVPDDKVDALKTATNWSTYADIIVPLSTLVE